VREVIKIMLVEPCYPSLQVEGTNINWIVIEKRAIIEGDGGNTEKEYS